MLRLVETSRVKLDQYVNVAPASQIALAQELGNSLKGVRVAHVNTTANGGGVAEVLRGLVPLMEDVGLDARWYVLEGDPSFFAITKRLHNLLQGAEGELTPEERDIYVGHIEKVAKSLKAQPIEADVWFMHDPQTLLLGTLLAPETPKAWVCHIDTTAPNQPVLQGLVPWMREYARVLFSLPQYVVAGLDPAQTCVIPPAIDAFTIKNRELELADARSILARLGLDPSRPILAQVSRFDRWKDPWGVIDAYRLIKREFPTVQLALVGVIESPDDPEAYAIVESVRLHAAGNPDIHLFTDPKQVGHAEVAAFQKGADVVIQKSVREGFGLSVTEPLWKGTPVVGGNCGGIRLQILHGETGFLVDTVEECAERVLDLLRSPQLGQQLGSAGKEHVRDRFLMPRLLADYLSVGSALRNGSSPVSSFSP